MIYHAFLLIAMIGTSCEGEAAQKRSRPQPQPPRVVGGGRLSADGKRLLLARALTGEVTDQMRIGFKHMQLWDLTTGKELRSFTDDVYPVAFLPDGDHAILAKKNEERTLVLWDVTTGRRLSSFGLI